MNRRELNIVLIIFIVLVLIFIAIFTIHCIKEKRSGIIEDTIPMPTNIALNTENATYVYVIKQTIKPALLEMTTNIPTSEPTNVLMIKLATPKPTNTPRPGNTPKHTTKPTSTPKPTNTPQPTAVPLQYPITYTDDTVTITIYREWYKQAWCYEAHLQFIDYSRFGSECANGKYNRGYETTSHCANRIGALLCVNGDYSAPSLNYGVVRNGKVWNDKAYYASGSYNSYNGKLFWTNEGSPTSGQLLSNLVVQHKVTDSFSFGPDFLRDGKIIRVTQGGSRRPRTFIGTNGKAGDIWIIVADGDKNDKQSSGLTSYECAKLLQEKGCIFGIPLDGGGSSTMVWKGKVLNAVKGNERAVVDFVYFR